MDKSGHLKIETFVLKASDRLRKMLKVDERNGVFPNCGPSFQPSPQGPLETPFT